MMLREHRIVGAVTPGGIIALGKINSDRLPSRFVFTDDAGPCIGMLPEGLTGS